MDLEGNSQFVIKIFVFIKDSGPPQLERNLEIRLIRKLTRWDLRTINLYSSATVFDTTFIARGNVYQSASLYLIDEFKGSYD